MSLSHEKADVFIYIMWNVTHTRSESTKIAQVQSGARHAFIVSNKVLRIRFGKVKAKVGRPTPHGIFHHVQLLGFFWKDFPSIYDVIFERT